MNKAPLAILICVAMVGCDDNANLPPTPPASGVPTSPSGNGSATTTVPAVVPPAATSPAAAVQNVVAESFTLQISPGWKSLPVTGGLAVTNPLDLQTGKQLVVTISVVPVPTLPGKTSADAVKGMIGVDKIGGDLESESEITLSGRPATKVTKRYQFKLTETTEATHRMVKVYCPTDSGVFLLQVDTDENILNPLMPQLDAIIASIKLK